jgi:hypothetical protein
VGEKGWEGTPLTRIEKKVEEVSLMIQSTQWLSKPKASRRECMYCQLILSKYLERSSLMSIPGVFVIFSEWITSCARMTFHDFPAFHIALFLFGDDKRQELV